MDHEPATLFTIGTSGTTAEHFFNRLRAANVRSVIDVRLRRATQFAGFAKDPDLAFFLRTLDGIAYRAVPQLAPSDDLLRRYRAKKISWNDYAEAYVKLLHARNAIATLHAPDLDRACFLCAESQATRCHRRLAAEEFAAAYRPLVIRHLGGTQHERPISE